MKTALRFAVLAMFVLCTASVGAAPALAAAPTAASGQQIRYVALTVGEQGQPIRSKVITAQQAAALLATAPSPARQRGSVSPNITPVPCNDNGFLHFSGPGGDWCFANDGDWGQRLPSVDQVWTGNNGANWVEDTGSTLINFPGDGNQVCRNTLTVFVDGGHVVTRDIRKEGIAGRGFQPCD